MEEMCYGARTFSTLLASSNGKSFFLSILVVGNLFDRDKVVKPFPEEFIGITRIICPTLHFASNSSRLMKQQVEIPVIYCFLGNKFSIVL